MSHSIEQNGESASSPQTRWPEHWTRFHRFELAAVRSQVRIASHFTLRPVALGLNLLGDGWMYPLLAFLVWWYYPKGFLAVALAAGLSAAAAHIIYPRIKRYIARPRPYEADPKMPPLLATLDRYSFPSGHCMTITAVLFPVSSAHPALLMPSTVACLAIAWARMAAAHHYPSDLLAGIVLGLAVATPAAWSLA